MRKLIFVPFMLLIAAFSMAAVIEVPEAPANMLIVQGGVEDEAPPAGGGISDDFSGDLSNWTTKTGTWSIASGELSITTDSGGVILYTADTLSTTSGYILVKIADRTNFMGVAFRSRNSGSGNMYAFRLNDDNTGVWRYCPDSTHSGCSDIQSQDFSASFSDGYYLGIAWSGTGSSTEVDAWRFDSDPGAFSTWGVADLTYDSDPGANAADSGGYVGAYHGSTTGGKWDDFEAGDQ